MTAREQTPMKRVLILCTGNSCRSQMAEAFLRSFDARLHVASAGTQPAPHVHPMAVQVMKERGIDISHATPKSVEDFLQQEFDFVITVCDNARESCPLFTGSVRYRLHMGFEDPALARGSEADRLATFRRIRDEIHETFLDFYNASLNS